jgi:hypothetical protein
MATIADLVFGRRVDTALSKRMHHRMEQEQGTSEIIVG